MRFKRLINFEYKLQKRLAEIRQGFTPACWECLDLDYTLEFETAKPTVCIPCAWKNMHALQKFIKGIYRIEET